MTSKLLATPLIHNDHALIPGMMGAGLLVPSKSGTRSSKSIAGQFVPGSQILGASVVRSLHVDEQVEVYQLSREEGLSVLKIDHSSPRREYAATVLSRLNHEAAFLAHLGGATAPKLLDKGELDGRAYLEMEFVDGVDAVTAAAKWRERGGAQGREMLLRLAQAIVRAYATLHEHGILHGDVRPRNVLIRRDGSAVLFDFGLARPAVSQTVLPTPRERGGSPVFFEPEMARVALARLPSMPASALGEQHAVSALIYFLITGGHWQNFRVGREAMLEEIATLYPLSFRERGVESWPEMEAALGRALSKLPDARFPSVSAFSQALDSVTMPSMTNDLPGAKRVISRSSGSAQSHRHAGLSAAASEEGHLSIFERS